ncbi:MAG: ribonuclease Z [Ruminococcaceae bacterium]|nr:ribonuclease Z [Oscillospiraceae bacterium]
MKIITIGTSHGVPEPHRRCTSTLLETNGRYYFIDVGTFVVEDVINMGLTIDDIKAIFITHPHADHSDGLPSLITLSGWYREQHDTVVVLPQEEMIGGLTAWLNSVERLKSTINFRVTQEGDVYDDGFVKVSAVPTLHCKNSFAYYVEAEGKKLLFAGDMRSPDIDFPPRAFEEEFDLIVLEAAHFGPDGTLNALSKCNVKNVVYTHIAPHAEERLDEMEKEEFPYKCIKAYDGMELVL